MASGDTLLVFNPLNAEADSSGIATLDLRNDHPVVDFDDSTVEVVRFSAILPRIYGGSGITVYIHFAMTSATSGNVKWNAGFERLDAGGIDIDADSFGTSKTATVAVPAACGQIAVASIGLSDGSEIDNLQAGEAFRLEVAREGSLSSDTAAGDAELLFVELKET